MHKRDYCSICRSGATGVVSFSVNKDDAFIDEYRPLVLSVVRRVRAEFQLTSDPGDLEGSAFQGLLEARERFDPARGVQFSTFAYYRIRGAVIDHVRKAGYLSRRAWRHLRASDTTDRLCEASLDARGAHRGNADEASAAISATLGHLATAFVLTACADDFADRSEDAEERLLGAEERACLHELLDTLPDREQQLIRGYYFEGKRFDQLAVDLGVSKSWASRMHIKTLSELRKALTRRQELRPKLLRDSRDSD